MTKPSRTHTQLNSASGYRQKNLDAFNMFFEAKTYEILQLYQQTSILGNISNFNMTVVNDIVDIPTNIININTIQNIEDAAGWEDISHNDRNQSNDFRLILKNLRDGHLMKLKYKFSKKEYHDIFEANTVAAAAYRDAFENIKEYSLNALQLITQDELFDKIEDTVRRGYSGNAAGPNGEYDFGSDSSPIIVDVDAFGNLLDNVVYTLNRVFQSTYPTMGMPYAIVPPQIINMLPDADRARDVIRGNRSEGDEYAKLVKDGVVGSVKYKGVLLIPNYNMDTSPNGVYTILGGFAMFNKTQIYVTNMKPLQEVTYGDEMMWLQQYAGIGQVIKDDRGNVIMKVKLA